MTDATEFEAMERAGWSDPAIARGYADGFARATCFVARRLADEVGAKRGTRVLDLCSGHGVVAAELSARGASVTGLDFSPAMIALARDAAPEARFVQGDAMALEFEGDSFDAVTIGFGVPHFPDPARGLSEAARVLKPGGRIAFSVWRGKGSNGAFGWLFDAVARLGDPAVTLPSGPDAHALADHAVAASMVSDAGFVDVRSADMDTALHVSRPEALFDTFDRGAVRAASLLAGQKGTQRAAIRSDLARRTRTHGTRHDDGYLVPAPSVLVSATRH